LIWKAAGAEERGGAAGGVYPQRAAGAEGAGGVEKRRILAGLVEERMMRAGAIF